MKASSKASEAVRLAYLKGYRVRQGRVISPHGVVRKCQRYVCKKRPPYWRFNVGTGGGSRFPVGVHQLVAFQKFGEEIFKDGIHIRHLDNDSLNNLDDNIGIGTPSQNQLDRAPEDRKTQAAFAASHNQKYSVEFIEELRLSHAGGESYRDLENRLGIGRSTLSYYLSKKARRTSFNFPVT